MSLVMLRLSRTEESYSLLEAFPVDTRLAHLSPAERPGDPVSMLCDVRQAPHPL